MTKYGDLVKLDECQKCIYNIPGIRCVDYIKGKIQIQILEKGEPVINQTRVKGECSTTKEDLEKIVQEWFGDEAPEMLQLIKQSFPGVDNK